jgi:hypothetical protein
MTSVLDPERDGASKGGRVAWGRILFTLIVGACLAGCGGGGGGGGGGSTSSGQSGSTGGSLTVDFLSPQNGQILNPGDPVDWSITAQVSAGDNSGLAMFSVDLVQDVGNPEFFDLPPGERAPSGMDGFDRPGGLTNPSGDPWGSGYGGTPVGEKGRRNLAQIGGAQNTFGVPAPLLGPNADVRLGQDIDLDSGVGQSVGGLVVAEGSFIAPGTAGEYTFSIEGVLAATLDKVNVPPAWSPVTRAALIAGMDSFSFHVSTDKRGPGAEEMTESPGAAGSDAPAGGRGAVPPSPAEVVLPAEGAELNRTHMRFRWPAFTSPPAEYSLWIVEDDGGLDPFTSGLPLMELPVAGGEPRTVVTEGLEFGKDYAWQVTDGSQPDGTGTWTTRRFTIPALPAWAPVTTGVPSPGAGPMEPGVTLFNGPVHDSGGDGKYEDYLLAVDEEGEIIFFLPAYGNAWFSDVRLLDQGRLLSIWGYHAFETTLDGRVLWKESDGYTLHHEAFPMPSGHILTLAREIRMISDGTDAVEWVGDRIVEFDRHTREEIWSWSTFDHYSLLDGGPPEDWTHGNSAVYVETDDCIYFSSRHLDRITRIDYQTGAVVYHMGMDCPSGDNDFGHNLFSKQHAPQILPNGNMMVYDNGNDRIPLTDPRQTKAIEIAFDSPYSPTDAWIVWEHALVHGDGSPLFCFAWGDADRLPGGNTLVTGGADKMIFELNANADPVWKLTVEGRGTGQIDRIYRAERIPSLIVETPGDCDGDWDLDLIDLHALQASFTGMGPASLEYPATLSDYDGDGDIDEDDLSGFSFWMTGAQSALLPTR